eukprot:scaffold108468_cov63-Phaeocystis_antarctica.AAC.3
MNQRAPTKGRSAASVHVKGHVRRTFSDLADRILKPTLVSVDCRPGAAAGGFERERFQGARLEH